MKIANKLVIAALAWMFSRGSCIASPGWKLEDNAARDAAIARCVKQAHTQYPGEQEGNDRTAVYKACMTQAGFTP